MLDLGTVTKLDFRTVSATVAADALWRYFLRTFSAVTYDLKYPWDFRRMLPDGWHRILFPFLWVTLSISCKAYLFTKVALVEVIDPGQVRRIQNQPT
jgi:hypothetical protein